MKNTFKTFSGTLFNRLMLWSCGVTCIAMLSLVPTVMAEPWYIKPSAEIPLRRGQGTEFKIDAILPDGVEVNLLEEDGGWVRVVTLDGREGWMLKRYLSQEKPLAEIVATLRKENASLKEGRAAITGKNKEMDTRYELLQQQFDTCVADLGSIRSQYATLQEDTADVIRIKDELAASQEFIAGLRQELTVITTENDQLKDNQSIKWFLAGGGTLIFGCIVGVISSRSRKRKPSLY